MCNLKDVCGVISKNWIKIMVIKRMDKRKGKRSRKCKSKDSKNSKECQNLCRYKRRLKKLRSLVCKNIKSPIFNSNDTTNYNDLKAGQYILNVNNGALVVIAKDKTGKVDFMGSVSLKSINTIPKNFGMLNIVSNVPNVQKPYKVVYIDQPKSWWPIKDIAKSFYEMIDAGFNIINLAFMVDGVPQDMVLVWSREFTEMEDQNSYRTNIINYAHARGCAIMLSTGGATESTYYNTDPIAYAQNVANFVADNELDGVDFDLEHFGPKLIAPGANTSQETIDWLVAVTNETRKILGDDSLISHAPQAPYLGKIGSNTSWAGPLGGYVAVYQTCAQMNLVGINFLNVQYYNQNDSNYVTYDNIFVNSGTDFPESSVTDFPDDMKNILVLGKPMRKNIDASTGYNTPQEINSIIIKAKNQLNWNAGIMTWQYPYDESVPQQFITNWLNIVMNGF